MSLQLAGSIALVSLFNCGCGAKPTAPSNDPRPGPATPTADGGEEPSATDPSATDPSATDPSATDSAAPSDAPTAEPPSEPGECANDCERGIWPRIIVALDPRVAADSNVSATLASGEALALSAACPIMPGSFRCTLTSFGVPDLDTFTLAVTLPDGTTASAAVAVAPRNYCAQRIAYVQVATSGGEIDITSQELNPCSVLESDIE